MDEMVRLTLAISIPVWSALAIIGIFAAFYAGVAGIGVMFVIIIVVAIVWNRTLVLLSDRVYGMPPRGNPPPPGESRLRDIEAKLDEISRKMRD